MEGLDFNQLLMASIANERDDPEPELVEDDTSPKTPPLSAAAATGTSDETADSSRRCVPPLMPNATLTALRQSSSSLLPNSTANSQHGENQPEPVPALTNKEMKWKLKKEKDKERSHENRKKRRIDNPNAQEHGKKKYIDSATPLFKDAGIETAAVASTGYVGLGGRKRKAEKDEAHGKNKEDNGVVQPLADYSAAEALLQKLRGEKGYDLLKWKNL